MLQFPYKIRPIAAEKDSAEISVLIRESFKPWLDFDNISYLERLEKAGRDAAAHPFLTELLGFSYDSTGVVCVNEAGKILGVINTFRFQLNGRPCCLIANVCVDRFCRGQGIAVHMINEVEKIQRNDGVTGIYLQARVEKPDVLSLYRGSGFQVTDYRETWICPVKKQKDLYIDGYLLESIPSEDEVLFKQLFMKRYPSSVLWNLDYKRDLFYFAKAGVLGSLLRTGNGSFRCVSASDGQVKAWAAHQRLENEIDTMWFVPNENIADSDLTAALMLFVNKFGRKKPIKIDVPAQSDPAPYAEAGFVRLQRLAWMWKKL